MTQTSKEGILSQRHPLIARLILRTPSLTRALLMVRILASAILLGRSKSALPLGRLTAVSPTPATRMLCMSGPHLSSWLTSQCIPCDRRLRLLRSIPKCLLDDRKDLQRQLLLRYHCSAVRQFIVKFRMHRFIPARQCLDRPTYSGVRIGHRRKSLGSLHGIQLQLQYKIHPFQYDLLSRSTGAQGRHLFQLHCYVEQRAGCCGQLDDRTKASRASRLGIGFNPSITIS